MAGTSYGVNANEAVKLWSRKLAREALKKTYFRRFIGNTSDSMIQVFGDTNKGPGDRIRIPLRMQLTGNGVLGDEILEGEEESLTTYTDDLLIDQLRHATKSEGKMSEQRVPFSVRQEGMMGLSDWFADRWDTAFFNQLCGNTAQSNKRFTGQNATLAPTRQVFPASVTNDQGLTSATDHKFSLILIDKAVEDAKVTTTGSVPPPIRPINVNGKPYFVAFLHPYQVTDLRTTTSTSSSHPILWYDLQQSAIQGGRISDNPIFTGALGEYNGVILHESTRLPQGVNSSTSAAVSSTRRAVLCGAQAGAVAFGQGHSLNNYDYFEQLFDYGNALGIKAGCICGLKKLQFNSEDFGCVVMSSYAASHASA